MSSRSRSDSRSSKRGRSASPQPHTKLFITNLDGKADTKDLETELTRHFQKYGEVESVVVKRNRNSQYCFAFAEMKERSAAVDVVKNFDQSIVAGKQIKVEFQDDTKRRKDSNLGCYNCGKKGHFARECRAPKEEDRGYGRRGRYSRSRSRSRSDSRRKHKHKRRYRSRSRSSGRDRSYDRDKKSKKQAMKEEESIRGTETRRKRKSIEREVTLDLSALTSPSLILNVTHSNSFFFDTNFQKKC